MIEYSYDPRLRQIVGQDDAGLCDFYTLDEAKSLPDVPYDVLADAEEHAQYLDASREEYFKGC